MDNLKISSKNQSTNQDHGKIFASWEFPEFIKYQRNTAWYVFTALIGLFLIIYAVYTYNFLFAFIIVMLGFILVIYMAKEPMTVRFIITEDGLELNHHFYSYKEVDTFWIIYEPPEVKNLYFDFKSTLKPSFSIPLLNQDPLEIRTVLLKYLREDLEKEEESTTDLLERKFKL
jgi:hypothetical protein